jgi:predicted transcriptional regulator
MSIPIALLQKIHALAKQGVDGERASAQVLLQRLMDKHGITEADLHSLERTERRYPYTSAAQHRLIGQILHSTWPDLKVYIHKEKRFFLTDLTDAEHMQALLMIDHYSALLKQETDIFIEAFIRRNNLVVPLSDNEPEQDLTPEQELRLRRVYEMAATVKRATPHKRIGHGS